MIGDREEDFGEALASPAKGRELSSELAVGGVSARVAAFLLDGVDGRADAAFGQNPAIVR